MAGSHTCWIPFAVLSNWLGSSQIQGYAKQEQEQAIPKAVMSALLLVVLILLLCAGDIETNPGPRDELHPGVKNLLSLLEKAMKSLDQVFDGGNQESYLTTAMVQAGAELTEIIMDLKTNFDDIGLEDDGKQLQTEFAAHVAQNSEVLHLFYKVPKVLFHSKLSSVWLYCFSCDLVCSETGRGTIDVPSFWLDCYQYILELIVVWTDKSTSVCEQLVSSGLLLLNINFIRKVRYQNDNSEVKKRKKEKDYLFWYCVSLRMVSFLRS